MYSQLLVSGILPVLFAVIIIGSSFFGGLYELKVDAIAAKNTIHALRTNCLFFTSELREYLLDILDESDTTQIKSDIDVIRQRLSENLSEYARIAAEGEAANEKSLLNVKETISELNRIYNGLDRLPVSISQRDAEIEDVENTIMTTFESITMLAEKEIQIEMALLSWLVIGASIISLLGAYIFVRKLSKRIVGQIVSLKSATEHFGRGKLTERIVIDSPNEMGQLSLAFNKMADDLEKTLGALEQEIGRREVSEAKLMESHLNLEKRVKKRSEELKETYQQLAHAGRLTALGEMATGIAHEIRQPLSIIDLANRSLINFFKKKHTNRERAQFSAVKIGEQIQRADKIIDNMRSFARTESSDFKNIRLVEPVTLAASFFKEQCKLRNIDLEIESSKDVPKILADPQKIEQIVVNLISNARYAIETKKQDMGDGTPPMRILIKISPRPGIDGIMMEVTDTGAGMTVEEKENCLNPFFTTKQVGQGTGLGLSIVYNIVQEINGSIEIESEKDMGSTFRIILPAKEKIDEN